MALLSKVQIGQKITAQLFNNIIDAIRECQINSVVGSGGTIATFKRGPGGTTVSINSKRTGISANASFCPFDVSTSLSASQLLIKVDVGTLNGIYATNYADCLSFESTQISTTPTGSTSVVVDVTTDGQQVTAFELAKEDSISAMSPTTPLAPTNFKWPIAHIIDGVVYKTIGCGSLQASVKENVRVAKTPETPADNAYDIYYYWELQAV
jgi:hypothetical protein